MESNNLAGALAKAQSLMLSAAKNGYNPHFKSHFSTLEDLIEASREALSSNNLSICQYPDSDTDSTYLVTKLKHVSGQEEVSRVRIVMKDYSDIQKLGSAISYLKRYAYASMCGIATSEGDDDGNEASENARTNKPTHTSPISSSAASWFRRKIASREGLESKILEKYSISSLEELPYAEFHALKRQLGLDDNN